MKKHKINLKMRNIPKSRHTNPLRFKEHKGNRFSPQAAKRHL